MRGVERQGQNRDKLAGKTGTGTRYEAAMGDEGNAKVYEGGEEDNVKYETIQSRDEYEEGDAAGPNSTGPVPGLCDQSQF